MDFRRGARPVYHLNMTFTPKTLREPAADDSALDLQLAYDSREILNMLAGRLPLRDEIEALNHEKGIVYATQLLHRAILAAQPHSGFIRHVQSVKAVPQPKNEGQPPIEIVFVPSVTPCLRLSWGAHIPWMRVLARELGFTTDVIETNARETITGNARLIGDHLRKSAAQQIILVTVGRGTAEARLLFQRRGRAAKELEKVRGWINIGGSFGGSRAAAVRLGDRFANLEARAEFWLKRAKFTALQEISSETGIWRERMNVHDCMMIVSVFGLLAPERVPFALRSSFETLRAYGPNDGGVLAFEAMARPGLLYPVPGLSHLMEEVILGPVLQRMFTGMSTSIRQSDYFWRQIQAPAAL